MLKQQKGITLVALIITIIVLLILAGVTISLVLGDNGILNHAEDAGDRYQNAARNEAKGLNQTKHKEMPEVDKEVLLVIDGTTGQNAISQVKAFKEQADITGLILTKLDGTAKGGVVIGIVEENKIPVKYIGVGEQIDDMEVFNPEHFLEAII